MLAAGKEAAAARGLDFSRYVERLIIEDTTGAPAPSAWPPRSASSRSAVSSSMPWSSSSTPGTAARDPAHRRALDHGVLPLTGAIELGQVLDRSGITQDTTETVW
ncbi:hypothetical protein [Streptomyces sp. TRM68367]|uniref:hypothetical protein n=1 Tax=Streptomyces sp. TRM68367 TaxID=2758415 RepID=UPI0021CE0BC8|nr:hypothetical protein [Streptomyces sp. TRM68367]